jgi:hypothetical protein
MAHMREVVGSSPTATTKFCKAVHFSTFHLLSKTTRGSRTPKDSALSAKDSLYLFLANISPVVIGISPRRMARPMGTLGWHSLRRLTSSVRVLARTSSGNRCGSTQIVGTPCGCASADGGFGWARLNTAEAGNGTDSPILVLISDRLLCRSTTANKCAEHHAASGSEMAYREFLRLLHSGHDLHALQRCRQ